MRFSSKTILLLSVSSIGLSAHAQTVTVSVDSSQVIRTVDERVFGVNAVMWDPEAASEQTIDLVNQAGIRIIRIPGGSNSNLYHWKVNRSQLKDVQGGEQYESWAWATGFDKFAQLILGTNAQAFVSVNYGTGTPEEAAAWVAYSNAAVGTEGGAGDVNIGDDVNGSHWYTARYWANLRASTPVTPDDGQNFLRIGRADPIGIRHWEIGNENYGSWERDDQVPAHDPARYATRAKNYMDKMRAVDGTIKVGVVAVTGNQYNNWTRTLLQTLKSLSAAPDFLIYHRYDQAPGQESDAALLQSAKTWSNDAADLRSQLTNYYGAGSENIELVVTENNSVYTDPGKQSTSIVNGLFLADSVGNLLQTEFNALTWWDLRNGSPTDSTGKIIGNNSASLFGWRNYGDYGMLSSPHDGGASDYYTAYPTYYMMKLLKYFARGGDQIVKASSDSNLVSAFAANGPTHFSVLLVNKDPANTLSASIDLKGGEVHRSVDVHSYGVQNDAASKPNGSGCPDIDSRAISVDGSTFTADLPPYSAQVIVIESPGGPATQIATQILTQPTSITVTEGQSVTFAAKVIGCPSPQYLWKRVKGGKDIVPVNDILPYSGAQTPVLTISKATLDMSGDEFNLRAFNSFGDSSTPFVTLTVVPASSPTPTPSPSPSSSGGGGGSIGFLLSVLLAPLAARRSLARRASER
ncbi:MAG TPA: hypothetical protein VFS47_16420 [Steroidobacteraceae bacterium]|nr:hypothetical protein [Steroidobacteraceae bacterium]